MPLNSEHQPPLTPTQIESPDVVLLNREIAGLRHQLAAANEANAAQGLVEERSGIYVASKTRHAEMWKRYRANGVPIIATWIDEAGVGETDDFADLWLRCVREASTARALIVFRSGVDDVLKGAFIETGAALASGVPVLAVGFGPEFSFINHPLVTVYQTVDDAVDAALTPPHSDAAAQVRALVEALEEAKAWLPTLGGPTPQARGAKQESFWAMVDQVNTALAPFGRGK